MDADHSSSSDQPGPPPAGIEVRLQTAVEDFLAALQRGERPDRAQVVTAEPELAPWLDERLKVVELVFQAAQDDGAADHRHLPADRAQRLKCPHCGNQVQLVEPRTKEVTCLNCGSSFRVEPDTTATYHSSRATGNFGRFQVIELLGRGAFGEVYKARDSELDRFVALKVPRVDYFSNSEDAQRFLREARSAAGLRHPSIVQVHEIAHERGSPYIVSDYIEGLTLADLISGGRPGFRESAELVGHLADALDYAHRQKVIHRDIKPSNILLSSCGAGVSPATGQAGRPHHKTGQAGRLHHNEATRFVPYLTDFGLARRDEGEITVTLDGQVLGTPAYMSPEQAAGDHARVDGRSDVYSLGVVLYELLSGELPFRGSRRMLLHQVLHDEPRPPRTLNERIPRDLETICLNAMAKEPARRYHTAADFRDDLRRYLRGDAITARRVGRAERAGRWCRRNPLPAGLAASLFLALVVGTAISSYLAVAERESRVAAETAEGKAVATRDQALRAAARSLVTPLNPEALGVDGLSHSEREALWELATLQGEGLWLRYIDEGTRNPRLASALCARSEPAVIAAVGLSLERRGRAAALLLDRIRDASLSTGQRADVGLVGLELVEGPGPLTDACSDAIRDAIVGAEKPATSARSPWRSRYFWTTKSHVEPHALARFIASTLRASSAELLDGWDVADALGAIAERLDPAEAERSFDTVLQRATAARAIWAAGCGLARLSERIESVTATRVRGEAAHAMIRTLGEPGTFHKPDSLVAMAMRMEPAEGAAILIEALTASSLYWPQIPDRLVAIAAKMEEREGSAVCRGAARVLIGRMRSAISHGEGGLQSHCEFLVTLIAGIEPTGRAQVCDEAAKVLTDALERQPIRLDVCYGLATIAGVLQPEDAARICNRAADLLIKGLEGTSDRESRVKILIECALLAGHLREDDHRRADIEREEREALQVETSVKSLVELGKACVVFANCLGNNDSHRLRREVERALSVALDDNANIENLGHLAKGYASVATHLGRAESRRLRAKVSRKLTAALRDVKWDRDSGLELEAIVDGVSQVAEGMEPAEATSACGEAARALMALRGNAEIDVILQMSIAELSLIGLAKLAPQVEPAEAARMLTDSLRFEQGEKVHLELASALARVSARLDAPLRMRVRSDAASVLMRYMRKATSSWELFQLADALAAVAAEMGADEAGPIRAEAAMIISKQVSVSGWFPVSKPSWPETLLPLTQQMQPSDVAHLFGTAMRAQLGRLIVSLERGDGTWDQSVDRGLVESLVYCDRQTAANAAWLLAQIICYDGDPLFVMGKSKRPGYLGLSSFNKSLSEVPPTEAVDRGDKHVPPKGCRLTTPQLVELLKMPTCFGAARRVILDHLERRYDRRFNTIWAFVRFAEAEKLGLDFTSPPVRPDPAKMQLAEP